MRRKIIVASTLGLALSVGACAHNDVMVFGTQTDIALDVQTAATQGASPSIVLGYKRNEAVWMPLLANGKDSKVVSQAGSLDNAKYLATTTTYETDGTKVVVAQPYSVFASLGAKFNGSGGNGSANAGGGLAQFFATGEAAVSLSQNDALMTVLKASGSDAEATAQAAAVSAAAGNATATSIQAGLTQAQQDQLAPLAQQAVSVQQRRVNLVMACAIQKDGTYRWKDIVSATSESDENKAVYSKYTQVDLQKNLLADPVLTAEALKAGTSSLGCVGE